MTLIENYFPNLDIATFAKSLKELSQLPEHSVISGFETIKIPEGCPIKIPSSCKTVYEKNIFLKENYVQLGEEDSLPNRYWLIQKWGGIGGFKNSEKNKKLLELGGQFEQDLASGTLNKESFEVISSLFKVASFIKPKEYAIYDSRAIYALNWLLFKYTSATKFFPQPKGRSSALAQYDLHTIFNLSDRKISYVAAPDAYHAYCELLKKLSPVIYGEDKSEPYRAEMLLFTLATSFIVKKDGSGDIKNTLALSKKTKY